MKELDVVVDVRPSEDADGLIVMKQKVAFSGDADLVGSPVETRVRFTARKAQVSFLGYMDSDRRISFGANVKNVGIAPFVVSRVALVYASEQPEDQPTKGGAVRKGTGGVDLLPARYAKPGPLLAGEARDYYLPTEMFDEAALILTGLSPSQYRVATFCGDEEVGRLGGEQIRPYLANAKIRFHRRAQPQFDTLPEASRLAVVKAVASLRGIEPQEWPSVGATPLEQAPDTFVVEPGEDLVVLVSPAKDKGVEISDIVQKGGLDQFPNGEVGVKQ